MIAIVVVASRTLHGGRATLELPLYSNDEYCKRRACRYHMASTMLVDSLCRLDASCQFATPTNSASLNEGSLAIRDACFGVVRCLSHWTGSESFLFSGVLSQTGTSRFIETTTLFVQCVAKEHETLRPRTVTALHALLGAYCRVYQRNDETRNENDKNNKSMEIDNPWSQANGTVSDSKNPSLLANNSSTESKDREALA